MRTGRVQGGTAAGQKAGGASGSPAGWKEVEGTRVREVGRVESVRKRRCLYVHPQELGTGRKVLPSLSLLTLGGRPRVGHWRLRKTRPHEHTAGTEAQALQHFSLPAPSHPTSPFPAPTLYCSRVKNSPFEAHLQWRFPTLPSLLLPAPTDCLKQGSLNPRLQGLQRLRIPFLGVSQSCLCRWLRASRWPPALSPKPATPLKEGKEEVLTAGRAGLRL